MTWSVVKYSPMEAKTKENLLKLVKTEVKKAEKLALERRETAKNFRSASRSQQGDRRLFETAADLAESKYEELKLFKQELEQAGSQSEKTVVPFSLVIIKYPNGQKSQLYFVTRRVQIPGLLLVTEQSPIGQAIHGKKANDNFSYQITKNNQPSSVTGKIVEIR